MDATNDITSSQVSFFVRENAAIRSRLQTLKTEGNYSSHHLYKKHQGKTKRWTRKIRYHGMKLNFADTYIHFLISQSWFSLLTLFSVAGIFNASFFAVIYFLLDCGVDCSTKNNFFEAWNLSVQTFLTIGYGSLTPQTTFANVVVFLQGFTQLIMASIFAGIPYLKFSKPRSKILFSSHVVVGMTNQCPTMTFRFACLRNKNHLYQVKLCVDMVYVDKRDQMIRMIPLKLNKESTLIFNANYSIIHELSVNSPVHELWKKTKEGQQTLEEADVTFHVTLTGWDPVHQSEVHSSHFYSMRDVFFNCRFGDMFVKDQMTQKLVCNLNNINEILLQNVESSDEIVRWMGEISSERFLERWLEEEEEEEEVEVEEVEEEEQQEEEVVDGYTNPMLANVTTSSSRKCTVSDASKEFAEGMGKNFRSITTKFKSTKKSIGLSQSCSRMLCCCCRRHCCPDHSVLCGCCVGESDHHAVLFGPLGTDHGTNGSDGVNVTGHNKIYEFYHGSTWFWYVLRWSLLSFVGLVLLLYTALCTSMALPLYITNIVTHTNLIQNVSPTTGMILDNVTKSATYKNSFFFSHQTISSIGYGVLSPRSDVSNWFVAFFGFFGFIVLSMLSGVIWSKFTTSNGALVAISKVIVITKFQGKRALMFRMAGLWRHHPITTATVTAMVYVPHRNDADGQVHMVSKPLKFVRSFNPLFILPGTFVHIMEDDDSPLKDLTRNELLKKNSTSNQLWISLVFEGVDTCRGETAAGQYRFTHEDILWGQRFEDILRFDTVSDLIHVNMEKFHLTVQDGMVEEEDEEEEKKIEVGREIVV